MEKAINTLNYDQWNGEGYNPMVVDYYTAIKMSVPEPCVSTWLYPYNVIMYWRDNGIWLFSNVIFRGTGNIIVIFHCVDIEKYWIHNSGYL